MAPVSFRGERPANHRRFFCDNGQVSAGRRVWLSAALLPLLQCALTDAISPREFTLRHFHSLANSFHIDGLRPNLLKLNHAALVSEDSFHPLDEVRTKSALPGSHFLRHLLHSL